MSDTTRRDFLTAAGFALAAVAGAGVSQAQPQDDKKKDPEDKEKKRDDDELFGNEPEEKKEEETRACPQCGAIMYRQGNTWTCDVCGYSYVE